MPWLFYALMYPLLFSIGNVLDKYLLEKRIKNYYACGVLAGAVTLIVVLVLLFFVGLPELGSMVIYVGIFTGTLYGITAFLYYHVLTNAEVSRAIGVYYVYPIFVAIFSYVFLGEQLNLVKYLAILLAIIGAFILAIENTKGKFKLNHVLWLMVLSAFLFGLIDVSDKYVVNNLNFLEAYILVTIPYAIVLIMPIFNKTVRRNIPYTFKSIKVIVLIEIIYLIANLFFFKAASLAEITIVSTMGVLQPVFVFLFALLLSLFLPKFIKETITLKALATKLIGILFVVIGAVILSL